MGQAYSAKILSIEDAKALLGAECQRFEAVYHRLAGF